MVRFSVYNKFISQGGNKMFDYISVKEAASKWGISERRVQKLCENSRIDGVMRFGHSWMIPKIVEKPCDLRKKKGCDKRNDASD